MKLEALEQLAFLNSGATGVDVGLGVRIGSSFLLLLLLLLLLLVMPSVPACQGRTRRRLCSQQEQ